MREYLDRLIDQTIEEALETSGCVVIEGPKWCGKSTTGKRFAKTVVELAKPNLYRQYKVYADMGDPTLFKGEKPLMFDEWQKIADLWDYIRANVDETGLRGQYILTGSTKPRYDQGRHSGTGRMKKIIMRPMSLWESKESTGEVSLKGLFDGTGSYSGKNNYSLSDIAFLLCRGGWPQAVQDEKKSVALKAAGNYITMLVEEDIRDADGKNYNPIRARAILRAYARNISTPARMATIQGDMEANDAVLDPRTLGSYINAFEKLYVVEDVEAWSPKLRSKTLLRTTNTRQIADPSLAVAVINATPDDLISDLNTFGLLFESFCIRDLRVYAEKLNGKVFNYRDSTGLEADAIVHLNNGQWGAIEIKLGGDDHIDAGAKHLLELQERVDTDKMKKPSFLMVMTATQFAYKRPDGVYVAPIACLKD